jgi:hypothetical protein
MNLEHTLLAALVAGLVSVAVGVISYLSNRSTVRHEVRQTQFKDVVAKRIELYPGLWRIHIFYETNWNLEGKPKTREWAEQYVSALNEFNLEGGLFFSEDLYRKFGDLRAGLYEAIRSTKPNGVVEASLAEKIRFAVYGGRGIAGLSTYVKDDLGSYQFVTLQKRGGG